MLETYNFYNTTTKKPNNKMQRLYIIIILSLFIRTCYAQLNLFEGTWIEQSSDTDLGGELFNRKETYKITVVKPQVYIRYKRLITKEGRTEEVRYNEIKEIEIDGDSIIYCRRYEPPIWRDGAQLGLSPNNKEFNNFVMSSKVQLVRKGSVLIEKTLDVTIYYYKDNVKVDSKIIRPESDEEYIYYNENDDF